MLKLKNLKFGALLALFLNLNSYAAIDQRKQEEIRQMILEYLDTSKQSTKPFEQWIDDLKTLIDKEPDFARFLPILSNIRNQRNANIVKLEIVKSRNLAPAFVQKILNSKPVAELARVIETRVKIRKAS